MASVFSPVPFMIEMNFVGRELPCELPCADDIVLMVMGGDKLRQKPLNLKSAFETKSLTVSFLFSKEGAIEVH